ncbi:MAG: right-handed parallel beta-helix repeat-containing protein [Bacteroidales bacterium]|nr:right-handed parallel beta-helix repeat-containing protein [Bacteroidales bacterium]MCF8389414.1 right-handed parallel beta-helix repeat-containing protein [Bacteroidales bacterium]
MKKLLIRISATFIISIMLIIKLSANTYFVSPQGSDSNPGSFSLPFQSIKKAVDVSIAGDTMYVRGGIYSLTSTILISKNGSAENYFHLIAFPGERAKLNFTAQTMGGSNRGILLTGNYWHIEGFDVYGAGDNGLKIEGGNYNSIVNCAFYRNRDSGVQMGNGASYNEVINCDSYLNADPTDYGDADGFAAKLNVGVENYFYGCRAWKNCDDGWDGYMRDANNASTILENCWAFENGYLEDGSDPGAQANGNGFKMGGSDDKTLSHHYTLTNCLAFNNKAKGFDQNSNMGSMKLYNCTGYNNLGGNYVIYKTLAEGNELIIKNCLALGDAGNIADFAIQVNNSWLPPYLVSEDDFISINAIEAYGARNPDGSLPNISYMHITEGSDLIDAGVDLGLFFNGLAPDLGCFETDYGNPETVNYRETDREKSRCFPNPASENIYIEFSSDSQSDYSINILDLSGRIIIRKDFFQMESGKIKAEISLPELIPGMYLYQVKIRNEILGTGKFILEDTR